MKKILTLLVLSLSLATSLYAQKGNVSKLKGDFPFNETLHIIQQPAVNGACGSALSGPVSEGIITDTGIWSFDGKGKVHINDSGTFITVNPPTDASQVVPEAAECKGTYSMIDDATVDLHYNCSTDNWNSYFVVHTTGRFTNNTLLVEVWHNADGSLEVTPYVYGNTVVACTYVLENTVAALK